MAVSNNKVFSYPKKKVYDALIKAIPQIKSMSLAESNYEKGQLLAKTGMGWGSWGEDILLSMEELTPEKTLVTATSTPLSTIIGQTYFNFDKNRKNIEMIFEKTVQLLTQ